MNVDRQLQLAEACVRSLADQSLVAINDAQISGLGRGQLDSLALWFAHHDAQLHNRFRPDHPVAAFLFDALEQERFEALGCNGYAGIELNLDARSQQERRQSNLAQSDKPSLVILQQSIGDHCRTLFRKTRQSLPIRGSTISGERLAIAPLIDSLLPELVGLLPDQEQYAQKSRHALIDWIEQRSASSFLDGEVSHQQVDDSSSQELVDQRESEDEDFNPHVSEPDATDSSSMDENEQTDDESLHESDAEHLVAVANQPEQGPGDSARDPNIVVLASSEPYKAFTTEFDEIALATRYADRSALRDWRKELDQHIDVHARLVRRLAARLQRVLLARQRRHWQFDQEEGLIDSARLPGIVMNPMQTLSFKVESDSVQRNTAITLLIDNSRSMIGRPIMIAAACTDILARTLERCGVSVEILGFTTVHLHGGQSTDLWESRGRPANPGRLNDLRHIIYKSATTSYRSARQNLGLMLDKDILKQNIDGEALSWAYQRLLKRPEERRILLVVSDGAPVDTSTLSANDGDYLTQHLRDVVEGIEKTRQVELLAIGIGHDVSGIYSHALNVFDARQLGAAMLNELDSLFHQVS